MTARPIRMLLRADADRVLGLGHLRRALSLARAAAARGATIDFVIRDQKEAAVRIDSAGFRAVALARGLAVDEEFHQVARLAHRIGTDVIIVDTAGVEVQHLGVLRAAGPCVVCVEDEPFEERPLGEHPCDLVVNGAVYAADIPRRANERCAFLLGPNYCILDPEYERVPERSTTSPVENVLLTLGGSDPRVLAPVLLRAIGASRHSFKITVIEGPMFLRGALDQVAAEVGRSRAVDLVRAPGSLFPHLSAAALAVSAAGQTLYELAAIGTPTIAVRAARDQMRQLDAMAARGVVVSAGDATVDDVADRVARCVDTLIDSPERRASLSAAGRRLVDGAGARRVATRVIQLVNELRAVSIGASAAYD